MKRLGVVVAASALALGTLFGGSPAMAVDPGPIIEPGPNGQVPTQQDIQNVIDAMVANGETLAQAQIDVQDTALRDAYPVSAIDDVALDAPTKVTSSSTSRLGSSCTGSSRSGVGTRSFYTWWKERIGYARINFTWCYNGKQVTWETHSKRTWLATWAQAGGWYFNSWTDTEEYFYDYNGRYHGGVKVAEEAYFRYCSPIRVICANNAFVRPRVYLHYDGTAS